MAKIIADRVQEISTTVGTGSYTLEGTVLGFRTFANAPMVNGDTCDYYAEDVDSRGIPTGGWEVGLGTWQTGGILARTSIYTSSNANAAVNWTSGTRRIALTVSANHFSTPTSANAVTNVPAGNIAATTVQAAINELDTEKLAIGSTAVNSTKWDGANKIVSTAGPSGGVDGDIWITRAV